MADVSARPAPQCAKFGEKIRSGKLPTVGAMETVKAVIGGVLFVCVVACVYWVGPTAWYSLKYHVPHEDVYINPKLTDCNWWHPPIGLKRCHYERLVVIVSQWAEGNKGGRIAIPNPTKKVGRHVRRTNGIGT